jgi:tetratricopeptide (TPR) repeat protein
VIAVADEQIGPSQFQLLVERLKTKPGDIVLGNQLRKLCRETKRYDECIDLFGELVKENPHNVNLRYNTALAYVDKLPGHSVLAQARLSTRSIEQMTAVLDVQPNDWLALYIRGINNIYWPSWYRRTGLAINDLERCVKLAEASPPAERMGYYALAYVALGDALIKAGREPDAKAVWREANKFVAWQDQLSPRLKKNGEELREFVDAIRSRDVPIDTDLAILLSATAEHTR